MRRPTKKSTKIIKSGSASAGDNGLVVTGVVHGSVGLAQPVHTAYLEQVWRIAPPSLVGRQVELYDLAAFCTQEDQGSYAWWRASAWSGKTALMSWFVLHPPPRVHIVSFFITARMAAQNDRVAFTDAVLEQLADLLGHRPMPAVLTDTTRDAHMLALLREAAQACQKDGCRLVLLVDGLDEDRGITGPSGHSIAGLLPAQPPAGCRIIVAGRPNPAVFPDVDSSHPLMDARIVRSLTTSPDATAVRTDMERELDQLLKGSTEDRKLLGLVVAAGGGLSVPDLAELTDSSKYEIRQRLNTVMGRSFRSRPSRYQPGLGPDLYVLGHEDLQKKAIEVLGERRLSRYRRLLHDWAGGYRDSDWPAGTPEYLLRGYHRMLVATGDTTRLVALTTSRARHDRMLDITGGDAAAVGEITTVRKILLAQKQPDVPVLTQLSAHLDDLAGRSRLRAPGPPG